MVNANHSRPRIVLVYLERRKTKQYVGQLIGTPGGKKGPYEFEYDLPYLLNKNAIPLGPDFPLTQQKFKSEKLFQTFEDRIPSRKNPAYVEYCADAGIDPKETDPMALLPTIGKRGASSFIFEKPETSEDELNNEAMGFRRSLGITLREFAAAFGFSTVTIQKIESGKAKPSEAVKRLRIYAHFPQIALWEIEQNKLKLHWKVYEALKKRLEEITLAKLKASGENHKE
jgi:HipA-like protein